MPLHCFSQEFQRGLLVSVYCDKALKHLVFLVDSPPKLEPFAIDLHENLVEMPAPMTRLHSRNAPLFDIRCKHRTKSMPPVPDSFVTDINTAFVEQIFHVAQRKRKPDVQHHHKADGLWARLEVFEWGSFAHGRTLLPCPTRLEPV